MRFRGDWGYEARLPVKPTDTVVGSASRIAVYRERVANGQPLFIDGDRRGARPALAYSAPSIGYGFQVDGDDQRGSLYDDHFEYRYSRWFKFKKAEGRHVLFIGFSPCEEFDKQAAAWGMFHQMHAVTVVNLYATRQPVFAPSCNAGEIQLLRLQLEDADRQLEINPDDQVSMRLALELEDQIDSLEDRGREELAQTLNTQADIIGPLNDVVIRHCVANASIIVLAWGHGGCDEIVERAARLTHAIRRQAPNGALFCFGLENNQPIGVNQLPVMRAPKIEGEAELTGEDDD